MTRTVVCRIKFLDLDDRVTTVVDIHADLDSNVWVEYDGFKYEGYADVASAHADVLDSFPADCYAMTSVKHYPH